jgi:hypothetical protein
MYFNLWLEGAGGTPQVRGLTPGIGLKNLTHQFHSKHMINVLSSVVLVVGPYVWMGKAYISKHKLRTGGEHSPTDRVFFYCSSNVCCEMNFDVPCIRII